MTYLEIIKEKDIELVCQPKGRIFADIDGRDVKKSKLRSILYYGNRGAWIGNSQFESTLGSLFFSLVRKGKLEIPTDYDTCPKCGGSGNVGYNVDGGTCWRCNGVGYKKK